MTKKNLLLMALLATACPISFVACDDDDDNNNESTEYEYIVDKTGRSFKYVFPASVDASGTTTTILLTADDLTNSATTISPEGTGFTIQGGTFYINFDEEYLYSMTYNQGNGGTNKSYLINASGNVEQRDYELTGLRFTSLGQFDSHILTVSTGDGPESKADANGDLPQCFLLTDIDPITQGQTFNDTEANFDSYVAENYLDNGEYVILCGLTEANGSLYTAAVGAGMSAYGLNAYSDKVVDESLITTNARSGATSISATQYPNECWVAVYSDRTLTSKRLIKTDKISYAAGRYRSQYHQMIWATDNGDVYVFSPSYAKTLSNDIQKTTLNAGVVRIKKGATEFDSSYYVDLESQLGAGFLRTWYLYDNYFLIRVYEEAYGDDFTGNALHLAVFNAETGKATNVSGLPDASLINDILHGANQVLVEDGKAIVDVSTSDGNPAFYVVNVETATATKGATVKASGINCASKLYFQTVAE